jgi:multidrug efflux pump subunit AcrB
MLWGRARFVFFAIACALVVAGVTIASAPQSVFPNIALARVEIFADAGDLTSEDVRTAVGLPLEAAVATLPGLRATRTYADPGKLELELDFDPASDPNDDLRAVRAALDGARARLPVTDLTALIEGPEAEPVVTYALTSKSVSQAELGRRVDAALVTTFTGTPGLGRLTAFGGPRVADEVALDPQRLAARGLSVRDVADAVAAANVPHVAGSLVRGEERLPVRSGATVSDPASLGAVGVSDPRRSGSVPLRTLATIRTVDEETGRQASFDATHAILLNAYPVPSGDAVALARDVAARLPVLRAALPADVQITVAWDQTRLILASQRALRFEMGAGALIALLAIALFLRDLALTLTAAIVLPVALALTVLVLVRAGLRLDLMTLGGLAIAIGLVVDETIVVVEAIARALDGHGGTTRRVAISAAVRRIAKPLVASTAANLVVFLPLAFLGGVPGFFFRALAITLAIALVVSIVLSLFVAPSLAAALGARTHAAPATRRLEGAYVALLRWTFRRPVAAYVVAAAAVALAAVLLARTPTDFLPSVDEGQFEIKYAMPPGMSLAAADALATTFERSIMLDPAVAHVARLSGVDTNGYVATPPDAGTMRVTVRGSDHFDAIADRVRNEIRNLNPNVAVEVHQLLEDQVNDLSGAPETIQLTVSGPVQSEIATIAYKLADQIQDIRGVVDTFDGVTWEPRSLQATPLAGDAESPAAFADDLRARVGGILATTLNDPGGPIPVVVRVADPVPLGRRVRLGAPVLSTTVQEENGRRIIRVTAGLENADLSTTIAKIEHNISPTVRDLPPGYSIDIGGAVAEQRASFTDFATILAIALVLVFAVLLATFDSFRLPLVVLAAVPLTPVGVALALAWTRTPLNVASFMGMLLLVGIVVRNGILLVEGANRRVREGASPIDAMERAATERLRPIAMTTFATLGALAPLALGFGAGSELERPLAIAVIGGIVTSTALTLAIVPLLYVATAGRGPARAQQRTSA